MSCSADISCPGPSSDFFNHVCDVLVFFLPRGAFVCYIQVSRYNYMMFICRCFRAVASLLFARLVGVQVSAPCVTAGSCTRVSSSRFQYYP